MNYKIFNRLAKTVFSFIIALSLCNIALANQENYSKIKTDSYKAIAEALFDDNTYDKFRIEIIETLGNLSVPDDKGYSDQSARDTMINKTVTSMLAAVTKSLKYKKGPLLNHDADKRAEEVSEKGDAAIAYMLGEMLKSDDKTLQLYAASSLLKVKEDSAYPLFVELLDSNKDQHKLVSLLVLRSIKNTEATHKIIDLIKDDDTPIKLKMNAMATLEEINPDKASEVAIGLLNSPEQKLQVEAITLLLSNKDPQGLTAYKELLNNKATEKSALLILPKLVKSLQKDSLDIIKEQYNSTDEFTRLFVLSSLMQLEKTDLAYDIFKEAIESDNLKLKMTAINTISLSNSASLAELLKSVTFENTELYYKFASILINTKNGLFDDVLKTLTDQNDPNLDVIVAHYFLQNGKNKDYSKELLLKYLDDKDDLNRYRAAVCLYENGFDEGADIVRSMLKSTDASFKARAVILLARREDKSVIPYLVDAIKDSNDSKKTYGAALILYNLGETDYLDVLNTLFVYGKHFPHQ